ncbi:MAG: hypothetical protein ACRDVP_08765 [Acidimicrobiales bacterium]
MARPVRQSEVAAFESTNFGSSGAGHEDGESTWELAADLLRWPKAPMIFEVKAVLEVTCWVGRRLAIPSRDDQFVRSSAP